MKTATSNGREWIMKENGVEVAIKDRLNVSELLARGNANGVDGMKKSKQAIKLAEKQEEVIRPRAFVPRPCSSCEALRPAGTSFSKCYCTRGEIRYCRCEYCNNTWSQYFTNCTMPIVRSDQKLSTTETSTPSLEHGISSITVSTD